MVDDVLHDAEQRMERSLEAFQHELAGVRAGRATPALLERIRVDYYGAPTPINQMATVSIPEARLIAIQPWDPNQLGAIERAIQTSDLGLVPQNDGKLIRLAIPQLTEERRKELAKAVKGMAEQARVALRNVRRESNDRLKDLGKQGDVSEDDVRAGQDRIQKLTDRCVARVGEMLDAKEREITEV